MALTLRNLALFGSVGGVSFYNYATTDAAATVLAAGYFDGARDKLKVNDVIMAVCASGGTGDVVQMKVSAVPASPGNVAVSSEGDVQANRAATATADGLTTGLLTAEDRAVDVTAANATDRMTLPAIASVPLNHTIRLSVAANGHRLVTPATSNTKINNVDADAGAATLTVPANSITLVTKQAADNWIAECFVAAGTRTIPTPA
jgi:hypothetical protein